MKITIAIYALLIILFSIVAISYDAELLETKVKQYSQAENALNASQQLSGYFQGTDDIPSDFNRDEKSHLEDVKNVLNGLQIALLLLVILLVATITTIETKKLMLYGGMITLGIVMITALLPFELIFLGMHQLMFLQGNWQFPTDSTIIQYFPQELFMSYAHTIALTIVILAITSVLVSFVIERG